MRAHCLPAVPMRIAIDFTLEPLKAIIAELQEHGTIDVIDIDGVDTPVFTREGKAYVVSHAVEGLIEWFDAAVGDTSLTVPLRDLLGALQGRVELRDSMLSELCRHMGRLKAAGRKVDPKIAAAIVHRQRQEAATEAA